MTGCRPLGLLAIPILVLACGSGSATPTPAPAPPPVKDAAASPDAATRLPAKFSYIALCAPCHGVDAKGYAADHAPSLVNQTFLESATDDFLARSIMFGRPGTSMGAYGKGRGGPLDDEAVRELVAYLRAQGPQAKPLTASAQPGDAARGSKLYATTCQTCHGDATARGDSVHLANAGFQQVATDPFLHYAIANGRPGTKMTAFGAQLSDAQIDDLIAYIRQLGGAAPAVGSLPAPTGNEPLVLNPKGKSPAFTLKEDRYVSVDDVHKAFAAKQKMIIIDARPPSEWMRVHITGAVSIPYHDMKRLDQIAKDDTWIIAYCACPHHLSGIVVDELRKRGYSHAVVLDEGINDWHRRGYPVTAAEGVKPPPSEPGMSARPPAPAH